MSLLTDDLFRSFHTNKTKHVRQKKKRYLTLNWSLRYKL